MLERKQKVSTTSPHQHPHSNDTSLLLEDHESDEQNGSQFWANSISLKNNLLFFTTETNFNSSDFGREPNSKATPSFSTPAEDSSSTDPSQEFPLGRLGNRNNACIEVLSALPSPVGQSTALRRENNKSQSSEQCCVQVSRCPGPLAEASLQKAQVLSEFSQWLQILGLK